MNQIHKTIVDQLGGNMFCTMVNVKRIIGGENKVTFEMSNRSGFKFFEVKYNEAQDLYELAFIKLRKSKVTRTNETKGVYCDQLRSIFESVTGLYISL